MAQKRVKQLIEEHELDPQPLNLVPDLAAARALFEDFVGEYEARWDALVAWNEKAMATGAKPQPPPTMDDARKLLDTIGGLVSRIEKIKSDGAVSRPDFIRIMTEMGRVVETLLDDEETKDRIKQAWLQIRLV